MDVELPNLGRIASKFVLVGKAAGMEAARQELTPMIIDVFAENDHDDLYRMILANYPLVRQDLPPGVKNALRNLGSNPQLRGQFENSVMTIITPENILALMHDPDEWLPDDAPAAQHRRIKACAQTIEETAGGEAWLERQVLDLYRIAGIIPEDSMPPEPND